ncbi:unnamed protein product [Symbiodinium pilosum]|uniref:Uncharacterized protein n=1 Tax=Symbiodinium pilosum TaxID=2952 RepID=A0A812YBT5_SYMPI|nr:unnamed protein product [Symbiodinium pilosum]
MAVIGESCSSLTPYGVGATLAQLGRGGLPNDKKPRRPVRIYGLGCTSAFERQFSSIESGNTALKWLSICSIGEIVLRAVLTCLMGFVTAPVILVAHAVALVSAAIALGMGAPAKCLALVMNDAKAFQVVEDIQNVATVGRVAKIMGASALHAIPASTPLGVMQNPYYRRTGLVHGEC